MKISIRVTELLTFRTNPKLPREIAAFRTNWWQGSKIRVSWSSQGLITITWPRGRILNLINQRSRVNHKAMAAWRWIKQMSKPQTLSTSQTTPCLFRNRVIYSSLTCRNTKTHRFWSPARRSINLRVGLPLKVRAKVLRFSSRWRTSNDNRLTTPSAAVSCIRSVILLSSSRAFKSADCNQTDAKSQAPKGATAS
jgi:hypothetical protein